jgi:nitrous oxidase accessory protein NosD
MRMFTILLAFLAVGSAACAKVLRPSSDDVSEAVRRAAPGDRIQLSSGVQRLVVIKKTNTGPAIVIEPAPGARPILSGSLVSASEGLVIRGVEVQPGATGYGLQIAGATRIRVEDVTFAAAAEDREAARGLQIKNSRDIAVTGSRFRNLRYGLMGDGVSGLLVEGNDFRSIYGDGMRGWVNSDNIVIRGNTFTDHFIPTSNPTHVDAIQFWTVNAVRPTTDVLIERNTITRGDGDPMQGIFVGNEKAVPYERVTIRDNAIVGSTWNGIWLVAGKEIVIENNLVQPMEWAERHTAEFGHIVPRIVVKNIQGGSVRGNVARIAADRKAALPDMRDNRPPKTAAFGDLSTLKAWKKRAE